MHSYFKIVIKYDEEHPEAINEFQIQEELITVFEAKDIDCVIDVYDLKQ